MTDYKDVVIDNDAIVNTDPQELPAEPYNIPQGKRPELNPNPGYGYADPVSRASETKPAIKTDLKDGGRGTPVQTVVAPKLGDKVEQAVVNFLNGIKIKGKNLEDYIDSQGGVTEEELQTALNPIIAQLGNINVTTGLPVLGKFNYNDLEITLIMTLQEWLANKDKILILVEDATTPTKFIVLYPSLYYGSNDIVYLGIVADALSDYERVMLLDVFVSGTSLTYYKTVYPIVIEANPTLAGTESNLTGLDVNGIKYKISGGTKLYKHHVEIDGTGIDIVCNQSESFITNPNGAKEAFEYGFVGISDWKPASITYLNLDDLLRINDYTGGTESEDLPSNCSDTVIEL